jgi:hypothetical protein
MNFRFAISGSHATGKSTVVAELRSELHDYTFVDEAYAHLLDEGHGFGLKPTIEDIESQLARSLTLIREASGPNVVFERCPVDYLAYLTALGADRETLQGWLAESEEALASLGMVFFVPIEQPDRISIDAEDLPKLRRRVDRMLRDILLADGWNLGLAVTPVEGPPGHRAGQILRSIGAMPGSAR